MNITTLKRKTEVIKATRAFFEAQNFLEVITPVLQTHLPLEPNVYAFATTWLARGATQPLFLATSPESSLKKIMAAGAGNCFALSHCFRNLEASGPTHTPEFLMLEWYRPNASYQDIMADTEHLLTFICQKLKLLLLPASAWPRLSLIELFHEYAGIDLPAAMGDTTLLQIAAKKGYATQDAAWDEVFDQIFLNEIEPHLPQTAFFLTDFPARTSPLCRPQALNPDFAERFEVYLKKMEIGNGNTENLDASQVEAAFKAEQVSRQQRQLTNPPIDPQFLASLDKLAKKYDSVAGIGLGIDRLAMIFADAKKIQDVAPLNVS